MIMTKKINRRHFLKSSALLASATAFSSSSSFAHLSSNGVPPSLLSQLSQPAAIPAKKGTRVVIVGGGWSGLTIAKYLKKSNPAFDVVLMDKSEQFVSCPMSNLWLADQIDLEFITHSFIDAAKNNDYLFLNTTAIELDRTSKIIYTADGSIAYDYLVLAPGIDYDYSKIGVENPEDEFHLRMNHPAGYGNASELMTIKNKLKNFKGGTFIMTVPNGNYRCMAAPYERACMAAAIFKKNNVHGKVLLLDMNTDIRIKAEGFKKAFEEYYGDSIQYESNANISSINIQDKDIETDFDNYGYDDALIYPPIKAASIIQKFGLVDPKSRQQEANIDPLKYHLIDDEYVYVTGDSRSQPFSKSGNTAHSEGRYVAEVISAHALGHEVEWRSPQTMCFSAVKIDPVESMSIIAFYKQDKENNNFAFDRVHLMDKWNQRAGQAGLAWAEGMYKDMFYK